MSIDFAKRIQMYMEALNTGPPTFYSENDMVYENDVLYLRFFRGGSGHPLLIVPPQAGHHSSIADFDSNQTLVGTAKEATDRPIFSIEWKTATLILPSTSISHLLAQAEKAMAYVRHTYPGRKIALVGLCQGGWLSSLLTIRNKVCVECLFVAGAPIDTHVGGGAIQKLVQKIPQSTYESIVKMGGGNMSGQLMLTAWKGMNFADRYFIDFQKLWNATTSEEAYHKIKQFRTWYEFTQDLGGEWYLWAIDKLFRKNELAQGILEIDGELMDLSTITCPVISISGEADDITIIAQCEAIHSLVANKPDQLNIAVRIPECGHVGVFMGSASQKVWYNTFKRYELI